MSGDEREIWAETKAMLTTSHVELGDYLSYQIRNTPRRLLFSLAYYKFAAKMLQPDSRVLELGCGEGLGSCILAEGAAAYVGVDMDEEMLASAQRNFSTPQRIFRAENFIGKHYGTFAAVVALDVVEHILPERDDGFWETAVHNLGDRGLMVLGTPNVTSQQYASAVSRSGHVNLYDHERLRRQAGRWFDYHFLFSANDETVHTGFSPMAHYLIVVACGPKRPASTPV